MEAGTDGSSSDLEIESEIWMLACLCLPPFAEQEDLETTEFPITVKSGIRLGGEQKVKRTLKSEASLSEIESG